MTHPAILSAWTEDPTEVNPVYTPADEIRWLSNLARRKPESVRLYALLVLSGRRRFDDTVRVVTVEMWLREWVGLNSEEYTR